MKLFSQAVLAETAAKATILIEPEFTDIGAWGVRNFRKGRVYVEQTTLFVPRLAPHWYFDTAERWAIEAAQRLAIDSWSGALRRAPEPAAP